MHKEQKPHGQGEQRDEEKSEKPVEECGRKAGPYGILAALHADVVNLLGVAAYVSGHEIVEEQPHVVELQQMPVFQFNVLPF